MSRPKSNGPYTPLSATYYRDDAILRAGERAELLFVRTLAFLADSSSDGFVTEMQMLKVVGLGLAKVQSRVDSLQSEGLLISIPGGFEVRSWSKWNKTAEEIGKYRKRDRERHASKSGPVEANSARNPDGMVTDSVPHYKSLHSTTNQITVNVAENRADVSQMCEHLADCIAGNGSLRPEVSKAWTTEARLLIDKDKRDFIAAMRLISWCQSDGFWKANILSMPTFRKKYDQLRLAANAQREARKPSRSEENLSVVQMYAARENEQGAINE